jgi:magnesium transporter
VVARETLTGLFVGILLGGLMFATIVAVWHDPAIAPAVAIAVTAASSIAVLVHSPCPGCFSGWDATPHSVPVHSPR